MRETLDFIDGFRLADTPARLFIVVGVSVILHTIAVVVTAKAIRDHDSEALSPGLSAGD